MGSMNFPDPNLTPNYEGWTWDGDKWEKDCDGSGGGSAPIVVVLPVLTRSGEILLPTEQNLGLPTLPVLTQSGAVVQLPLQAA
jgi:hypothetical protein